MRIVQAITHIAERRAVKPSQLALAWTRPHQSAQHPGERYPAAQMSTLTQ